MERRGLAREEVVRGGRHNHARALGLRGIVLVRGGGAILEAAAEGHHGLLADSGVLFVGVGGVDGLSRAAKGGRLRWHVATTLREACQDGGSGLDGRVHRLHVVHLVLVIVSFVSLLNLDTATTGKVVCESIVVPALKRNAAWVEAFVFDCNNLLLAFLANDNTGVSPREIVLVPERVDWEDERIDRECQDIDDHPSDVLPLSLEDENQSL